MPKFTMPKITFPKFDKSKVTMPKFASRLNTQPQIVKVAIIAVLAVLILWFVNYLLNGNLFLIIGWLLFFAVAAALLAVINPEETVKLAKQTKANWICYQVKLKRSIKELHALFSKKPELVVVDESEAPVADPSSATSRPTVATPAEAPAATSTVAPAPAPVVPADTKAPVAVVPSAPPAPVKSPKAKPVNAGSDGIAAVAVATSRVRRRSAAGTRNLAMPGDSDASE